VRNAWVKNCIAMGLASGFIEPLEATAIFMSDLGARWLHHFMPTQDFEPELAAAYNRQVRRLYEEVRDLVQLHYHLNNRRDTEYWKAAREGVKLSDRLKENLKVWRHTTPEPLDLESSFLFSSPVYTLVLIAKGFYKDAHLATASALNRQTYERYRNAVRDDRPDHLKGLIGQAEFLKTGGKAPGGPFAAPRAVDLPGFGPSNTKIKLPVHPQFPRGRGKRR
jgi:Tryptophan halogenase